MSAGCWGKVVGGGSRSTTANLSWSSRSYKVVFHEGGSANAQPVAKPYCGSVGRREIGKREREKEGERNTREREVQEFERDTRETAPPCE